ncbi:MAG: ABC transporter substrate-binding protein [Bdellovibrionales bacterium]|nr:ABC transporter substrate-binding protein [Bdellovibrionales bacterium]
MRLSLFAFILSLLLFVLEALASPPLQIGMIVPLSGSAALMGKSMEGVVKLAQLKNVQMVFEDDQCDAKKSISAYLKLRQQGIRIVYMACSGSILATAPLIRRNGDLLLTTYSGSTRVQELGTEVIRLNPDATSLAYALKKLLEAGHAPVSILYEEQEYASSLADKLQSLVPEMIRERVSYKADATTFQAELLRIKRTKPRYVVFVPVGDDAARIVLKEYAQLNIGIPLLGEVNLCDYPFQLPDFGLTGKCISAQLQGAAYEAFLKNYEAHVGYKSAFPFYDALAYDLLKYLDRLANEGIVNVDTIRERILAGFQGDFMHYSLTSNGESANAMDYLKVISYEGSQ